ncbi:MAG: glutamine amidotransferase-related protein, partial [Thermus sp.]|uniref:glutamine amidotransferase-related protein n=1 Tax=Thermus sp. TaxID=275 RepID=UPI003D118B98
YCRFWARGSGIWDRASRRVMPLLYPRAEISVKSGVRLLAWTEDGVPMALWDGRRAFGVQFHPESLLSPWGMRLLANFLEVG